MTTQVNNIILNPKETFNLLDDKASEGIENLATEIFAAGREMPERNTLPKGWCYTVISREFAPTTFSERVANVIKRIVSFVLSIFGCSKIQNANETMESASFALSVLKEKTRLVVVTATVGAKSEWRCETLGISAQKLSLDEIKEAFPKADQSELQRFLAARKNEKNSDCATPGQTERRTKYNRLGLRPSSLGQ